MLSLTNIRSYKWSKTNSKRLGRWNGSWKWTYCWRGCKGQNARAWWWVPAWFEWGQTPLFRRMPKLKGFSNARFKKEYNIINISDLETLSLKGINKVDEEILLQNNMIRKKAFPIKLLWNWELTNKIDVIVDKASVKAKNSVEKAWGKLEIK